MTYNLDNAIHGLQEARAAVMLESGDADTLEQEDAIEAIQVNINETEAMIKDYGKTD